MTPRKIRILSSPTVIIFSFICWCILLMFYLFTVVYEPCRTALLTEYIPTFIIWTLFCCGFCIGYILVGAQKMLCIITIDETGISRSFLGVFSKLHISWDEMAEAYSFISVVRFVTFSKYKKVSTMSNWKMRGEKNAIEMTLSKKRYAVIAQYIKQPIVGLPDSVKAQLTREKK